MTEERSRGVSRRDFAGAAVAIGGVAALSACLERERATPETAAEPAFPRGDDPDALPDGQHVWNRFLVRDAHGNTVLPQHQLLLGLSYVGSEPPTRAERESVEGALRTLERAFRWGTGGDSAAAVNDGLLAMLGYSQRYFERVGGRIDGLLGPEEVLEAVGEDATRADEFDAFLVLNSDYGSVLLAAEAAVTGERETVNGVEVTDTFEGVFEVAERRTGVVGKGLPAEKLDRDDVPAEAPLSMGFRSGFRDSQPSEEAVTIEEGPFSGGTTLLASRLRTDLDRWYDQSTDERVGKMFCPAHGVDDVGETGARLGSESSITRENVEDVAELSEKHGIVGHSQKVATARDDEFRPRILRRSESVATDVAEGTGFNFLSVQRRLADFVETRRAMNPGEYDVDVEPEDHGIVDYLETRARGTFVVPPREARALPVP